MPQVEQAGEFAGTSGRNDANSNNLSFERPYREAGKSKFRAWFRVSGISTSVLYCIVLHFLLAFIEMVQITPLLVLFERSICLQYYRTHNPTAIAPDGSIAETLCKISLVQQDLATVRGWKSSLDAIPVLLVAVQVGKIGDRYGRKKALAGSLCSILMSLTVTGVVCALPRNIPIRYVWLSSPCLLFGGGLLTAVSLMWALASQAIGEVERTTAFYYILAAFPLAEFFASVISAATTDISPWIPLSLAIIALLLSFVVLVAMPVGHEPPEGRPKPHHSNDALVTEDESLSLLRAEPPNNVAISSAKSRKPLADRPPSLNSSVGNRNDELEPQVPRSKNLKDVFSNTNLIASIPVFLVGTQRLTLLNVLMQYTSLRFGWPISRTSLFYTETAITNLVLFLILLPSLRSYLKERRGISPERIDHMTVRASVCFLSLGALCIGLAPTGSMLPFAVLVYTAGFGSKISTLALISYYIEDDSKAKFYAAVAVLENIGHGLGDPLIQHIFASVVDRGGYWLAAPFFVEAVLYGLAATWILIVPTARVV